MNRAFVGFLMGLLWPMLGWAGPTGVLELPQTLTYASGIGFISGWVCQARRVTIVFDRQITVNAQYGIDRADTQSVCGHSNTGFTFGPFNWALLGDGSHSVSARADGVKIGPTAIITVTTFGTEFLSGATGSCQVRNFPEAGKTTTLHWQEDIQNFVVTRVR